MTDLPKSPFAIPGTILEAYRGSIAHNMYVPNTDPDSVDDIDLFALVVPGRGYYHGLQTFGSSDTLEIFEGQWDVLAYELRKAIRLLEKGNPNVLSLLWLKDEHYLKRTRAAEILLHERDLFVGKHVFRSFMGYANAQLAKLEGKAYRGYMGTKRKELREKFGYDPKMAAHLIRLQRMGIEFLQTGQLQVYREDADELLAIKRGEWTLDQVKTAAEKGFVRAHEVMDNCKLPDRPDHNAVLNVCCEIIEEVIG